MGMARCAWSVLIPEIRASARSTSLFRHLFIMACLTCCATLSRYLLKAGYRVLMPLFRGTLGFGDDFAQVGYACSLHRGFVVAWQQRISLLSTPLVAKAS
eukprot:TRINITY_DN11933_c0_g1_i12.p2 TRINITY_DN11933_c0_g1~~TRINITY_DN11933_c0_g1_i12.p2  ORF type:complete len:100 (-),score=4.35 TRINITY_DN11933_c0_g1_i12:753-1052(-)